MTITMTYVAFVELVENVLGWTPPEGSLRRARSLEAMKLKRKMDTNPELYTWENMRTALEWCRRKKVLVATPASVCWKVEQALREGLGEEETTATGVSIQEAIGTEQARQDEMSEYWITRLTRSMGPAREEVLQEWKQAGR